MRFNFIKNDASALSKTEEFYKSSMRGGLQMQELAERARQANKVGSVQLILSHAFKVFVFYELHSLYL